MSINIYVKYSFKFYIKSQLLKRTLRKESNSLLPFIPSLYVSIITVPVQTKLGSRCASGLDNIVKPRTWLPRVSKKARPKTTFQK